MKSFFSNSFLPNSPFQNDISFFQRHEATVRERCAARREQSSSVVGWIRGCRKRTKRRRRREESFSFVVASRDDDDDDDDEEDGRTRWKKAQNIVDDDARRRKRDDEERDEERTLRGIHVRKMRRAIIERV